MNFDNILTTLLPKGRMLTAILSGAILISVVSACTDELPYPGFNEYDGELVTVPVSFLVEDIQAEDPETRAITYLDPTSEDETTIHDFWIIEYHENGSRVGLPRYYTLNSKLPENINIIIPRRDEDVFTCVMIANTNDSVLFNADNTARYNTLDRLRTFEMGTHNHEHVFNPNAGKYLLMSGWTTITTDPKTHDLHFDLIRNVCKVKVTLTDFNDEDLIYKYFQWRDVPLGKVFPHGNINYTQHVSRDWKQHLDDDPKEEQKRKNLEDGLIFYLPCNVWLPDGPGTTLDKTTRKEDVTHFVVVARENLGEDEEGNVIESGEQYEFCLYPSMDIDKQFDFKPNHYYEMEMAITKMPSEREENDFINLIDYKYLEESNCYMVKRDSKDLIAVPLTRINRYWSIYSETGGKELLEEDTEWVAEVIWQDTPARIIEFTSFKRFQVASDKSHLEAKGEIYRGLDGETVENKVPLGDGEELPMCFAFRPTGVGEGNVVIGVRKKVPGWQTIPVEKREYLWSWHIWVTDYDPNVIIPANSAAGEIDAGGGNGDVNYQWMHHEVPNGEVQKYPTAGEMAGSSIYMMDRNLGATLSFSKRSEIEEIFSHILAGNWTYRLSDVSRTFGMYYQYGRKDPFPYYDSDVQAVYDFYGNKIESMNHFPNMIISEQDEAWNSGEPTNVSIRYPYKFYTADRAHPFWYDWNLASDETDNHEWNDPGLGTFSGKKFFDPCPPGWKLPEDMYDTFTSIGQEDDAQWFSYYYDEERTTEDSGYSFFAAIMTYYDQNDKNFKDDGHFIYFPSTSKRDPENGGGVGGTIWALNAFNGTWTETKVMLVHNVPQANFESSLPACTGVPIRCMREYPN